MEKKMILLFGIILILASAFVIAFSGFIENSNNYSTNIEIPSNLVTLQSGISNRHSRTKGDTINGNVYSQNSLMDNSAKRIPINRIIHNDEQVKKTLNKLKG